MKEKETPSEIKSLKISVRLLNDEDINQRQLPTNTTGVIITDIASDSPIFTHMQVNEVIVEVQKKEIKNLKQFDNIVTEIINKGEKTLLFAIYNNQNQRRYLGIKLD